MIKLDELLNNILAWGCEIEIFETRKYEVPLVSGVCNSIDLPSSLSDAQVIHINPGIVTKIFIKEPKS